MFHPIATDRLQPDLGALLAALDLEKAALRERGLASFRRNSTTWELLLLVSKTDVNIQQAIRALETDCFGYSSIVRFITMQLQEGCFVTVPGKKRSEKILKPNADILAALEALNGQYGLFLERRTASGDAITGRQEA